MLQLEESINVWVYFKGRTVQPFMFFWNGRKIKIDKINLVHGSKEGEVTFYHFSVSAANNFYRLKFDTKKLKWFIEAVEEDN